MEHLKMTGRFKSWIAIKKELIRGNDFTSFRAA